MANARLDTRQWDAALAKLRGPLRVSLARSMAVAGGKVLRDEAKRHAPVSDGSTSLPYGQNARLPPRPGLLRDNIYLAFKPGMSSNAQVTYSVTWNGRLVKYGHLIEFGHWRYNKITVGGVPQKSKAGKSKAAPHTLPGALDVPQWVQAKPFLRPAFDIVGTLAKQAMIERGRVRVHELLAGIGVGPEIV